MDKSFDYLRPLSDFLADDYPEIAPRVPGLIPGGSGLVVIAGQQKVGKTWLAIDLFVAILTGGSFLGHPVAKERAAYVFYEGQPGAVQRRLRRAIRRGAVPTGGFISINPVDWRLDTPRGRDSLVVDIISSKASVVFLDPLALAHDLDENDNGAMGRFLADLRWHAYELGVLIVFVHHANKSVGDGGSRRIRGASSITAGTEANLVLTARGQLHRLEAELRDDRSSVVDLRWDPDECRFALAEPHAERPERATAAFRVAEILRAAADPMTAIEIADRAGLSDTGVRNIIRRLVADDQVTEARAPRGKAAAYRWRMPNA